MATKFNIKRVVKELKDLELDPPAGIICYSKDDSLKDLEARIKGPPDTPYSEGEFKLKITLPNNYPLSPPSIIFETPIYHPNIDESGVICLDILKKGNSGKWTPVQTLSTVLISLTVLLSEPNPDDPLRKEVADIFRRNPIQFRKLAEEYTLKYATSSSDADNTSNSSKAGNSPSEQQSSTTCTAEEEPNVSELLKVKKQSLSLRKKEVTVDSTSKSPIITNSSQFTIPPTTRFDDIYQSCVYNRSLSNLSQSPKNQPGSSNSNISLASNGKRKLNSSPSSSSLLQNNAKTDESPNQQKSLKITHDSKQSVENNRSLTKLQSCELKYSSSSNSSDNESKDVKSASKPLLKSKYFGSGRLKSILSSQEFISDINTDFNTSNTSKIANDSITISSNSSNEICDEVADIKLSLVSKEDEIESKSAKNSKTEDIKNTSNSEIEDEKIKDFKISEDSEIDKFSIKKFIQDKKDDQNLDEDMVGISKSDNDKADEIEIKISKERSDDELLSQKDAQNFDKEEELDKPNTHKESKADNDDDDDDIILISSSDAGSPPCENLLNQLIPDPILDSPIQEDTLIDKLTNSQNSNYSIGSPPLTDKDVTVISDTESNDGIEYKIPVIESLISRSQSSQDVRPEKSKSSLKKFRSTSDTVSSSKHKLKLKSNKNSPFSIFANSRFGKTNVEEEGAKNEDKFSPIKPNNDTQLFGTTNSSSSSTQDFRAKWGVDPTKFKTKSINLTLKRK